MRAPAPFLVLVFALLVSTSALARTKTYCVGGFDSTANHSCGTAAVTQQHAQWHHHCDVTDGTKCYSCWDERDDSCVSDFLASHSGWAQAAPWTCLLRPHDNATKVHEHVVGGTEVPPVPQPPVPQPPPTPPVGPAKPTPLTVSVEVVSQGPRTVGEEIALQGTVRDDAGGLRRPTAATFVIDDGQGHVQRVPAVVGADGKVEATVTLPPGDQVRISLEATGLSRPGETVAMQASVPLKLSVGAAFALALADDLDFWTVKAGTPMRAVCQKLDFSSSQSFEGQPFRLRLESAQACDAHPVWVGSSAGRELAVSLRQPVEVMGPSAAQPYWLLCLDVPRCAGETGDVPLRIEPRSAQHAASAKTVRLRWRVEGKSWLACHRWWLVPLAALSVPVLVIVGLVRPARFAPTAWIRVADQEKRLGTAPMMVLRECRGSAAGFYRNAALGLRSDGALTGKVRGVAVVLRATRDGLMIAGQFDELDRRTRKWQTVAEGPKGIAPVGNVAYRTGSIYFMIDAGLG